MHSWTIHLLSPALAGLLLAGCAGTDERSAETALPAPIAVVSPQVEQLAVQRLPAVQQVVTHAADTQPILMLATNQPNTAQLIPVPQTAPASPIQPANFTTSTTTAEPLPLPVQPVIPPDAKEVVAPGLVAPVVGGRPTLPVDFATAIGLTQGQNPRVAFAQAQISQAFAQYEAARVLWLPSLRGGMNYNKHEGRIQDVVGVNIETSRGAAYGGLGASAVGAGSPAIPGVYMQFHLTDAIHQPRIRAAGLAASEQLGTAALNDELLETALAYLALLEATQRKAIAAETLANGQMLADITQNFARTGAGNLADADRAAASLSLFRNELARADESIAVASARLNQQLSSDPSLLLVPQEPAVLPIDLVKEEEVAELVALGLANRPELAASRSLVGEAVNRLKREQNAPWLPSVILGMSYGSFGAGLGGEITRGGDRFDFDGIAYWELRNLGWGEKAARANAGAQVQQAKLREVQLLDSVAREVVEAHAQVQARRGMIAISQSAIQSAQQSYDRNLNRIRNAQGLPIEVLQSIQALDQARREYLRSVVDYNQAQFRLHRALGWPVSG